MTREQLITAFLSNNGWGGAERAPVQGDASTRAYERLTLNGDKAVLMNAPFEPSEDKYTKMAKLAGSNTEAFTCLATALTRRGFSAPRILAVDMENGLLLLEDLGTDLFAQVLKQQPGKEQEIYGEAISCLAAIYRSSFSEHLQTRSAKHTANWHVRAYDHDALQAEADLFLDWYISEFDTPLSSKAKTKWSKLWVNAYSRLDAHAPGLALRDFHAENIFWLPKRTATAKVGLIDFQDALFAHPSYDLVSLLEDTRRDVDKHMVNDLIAQFCQQAGIPHDEKFLAAYAVMGAQRNAKILGIFVRLANRDGKQHYLDMIPRVAAYFKNDLNHSALGDLHDWVCTYAPSIFKADK